MQNMLYLIKIIRLYNNLVYKGALFMNILHMKYAVEVANTRSISKAAENLYTSQPNLSRAIQSLENDLKIKIFKRSSKGHEITIDGE